LAYGITQSRNTSGIWNSSVVDHPVLPDNASQSNVSIDSRRTLTNLEAVPYKGSKGSPDSEQDLEKLNLPVYNPRANFSVYPGRGSLDTSERTRARGMGVHSINGAPVYRANGVPSSQGPHQFYANPPQSRSVPRLSSDNNHVDNTHQPRRIAPWHNDEESPSPAEIRHASRVNPSTSLYPSHVVNAGLTTRPVQTAVPAKTGALTDLLKAAGLRTSASSLPYTHSPNENAQQSVPGGTVSRTSSTNTRHAQTQSVSSFVQAAPPNVTDSTNVERTRASRRSLSDGNIIIHANRRKGPRHRPPPLNLSGLSNIANAERRR
jgi:hypothetical protein